MSPVYSVSTRWTDWSGLHKRQVQLTVLREETTIRAKKDHSNGNAEKTVKAIRRARRRRYAAKQKIRMVLEMDPENWTVR